MNRALVILLGSLLAASGAQATTYVRVEPDGTKTYSDRPIPGGHPIDLQPAQTYSAPPTTDSANSNLPRDQQMVMQAANFQYQACALTPKNDETFSNPESVNISLSLTPGLRYGDVVVFNVDGATVPGTAASTTFSMPQPARGAHSVNVQITDRSGKSLCNANTTFHVMRPSLNAPARRPRPTPH